MTLITKTTLACILIQSSLSLQCCRPCDTSAGGVRQPPITFPRQVPSGSPQCLRTGGGVTRLAITSNGDYVAACVRPTNTHSTGSLGQTVQVWSRRDQRQVSSISTVADGAIVSFSPRNLLLVTAEWRGGVQLWRGPKWKRCLTLGRSGLDSCTASAIAFDSSGSRLVAAYWPEGPGHEKQLRTWDVATKVSDTIASLPHLSDALAVDAAWRYLAVGTAGSDIIVWELGKKDAYWHFEAHIDPRTGRTGVQGVAILSDGKTLVSAGTDGCISVWNIPRKRHIRTFHPGVGEINEMAVRQDGKWIAVRGGSPASQQRDRCRIIALADGKEHPVNKSIPPNVGGIAFSGNGRWLAVGTNVHSDISRNNGAIFLFRMCDE